MVTHHAAYDLQGTIEETHCCESGIGVKAHVEDVCVGILGTIAAAKVTEGGAGADAAALDGAVGGLVLRGSLLLTSRVYFHTLHGFCLSLFD